MANPASSQPSQPESPDSGTASAEHPQFSADDLFAKPVVVPPTLTEEQVLELVRVALKQPRPSEKGGLAPHTEMAENDVRIEFSVKIWTKDGLQGNVTGVTSLAETLSDDLLPEAPISFQRAFDTSILRPMMVKFQTLVNGRVRAVKKAASAPALFGGNAALPDEGRRLLSSR